jgi:ACS family tartrate transporter-like MFS transporter
MFVRSATAFYVLRLALGAAEAGFFPGIIYCLTRWFPARDRARAIAGFMTAVVIAGIVGGPISGALLSLDGAGGLAGWQWLFLVEGVPAVVLGVVVLFALPDGPNEARWLNPAERDALTAQLEDEARVEHSVHTIRGALTDGRTWLLAAVYFAIPVELYALSFWLPQIIRSASGGSDFRVGALSAIPYAVAAVGMVIVSRHSDHTAERRWHIAMSAAIGGSSLILAGFFHGAAAAIVLLSLAMLGLTSMMGPFWALATASLGGVGAAAGIALINSVGNIGGFVGPNIVGFVRSATRDFGTGLAIVGAILIAGGVLVLAVKPARSV